MLRSLTVHSPEAFSDAESKTARNSASEYWLDCTAGVLM
jgi:hypothetical protein